MPEPERGEVWLVRFPFTDLSTAKVRPALVLAVHGEDIVVTSIFSRIPDVAFRETWLLVEETHPQFSLTGLKKTALPLTDELKSFFDEVSDFNLEVRYPEYRNAFGKRCTKDFCEDKFSKIKEHYKWLKSQLESGRS